MKVQKITTQPDFQPVTLQITIESQEELQAIHRLAGSNCSVASFLSTKGFIAPEHQSVCSIFLGSICQELNK